MSYRTQFVALAVVSLLVVAREASPSKAGDRIVVTLDGSSPALHFPVGPKNVEVEPAFEDYGFMLFDACDAMRLTADECMIFPMNGDLGGNAIATILDGNRVIIYDHELSSMLSGGYAAAMAVMAHELGHHYCEHIGAPTAPMKELEADRFAGAALRNAGLSMEDALSMAAIFASRSSRSHPAKKERVSALSEGWTDPARAKSCK
jgi:hypothetical protein